MSKTRQCLKTLNGGNLDTVQEFWDSSGILGQDSCNLTTGLICTDTLIILDSPLCEGVFSSEN